MKKQILIYAFFYWLISLSSLAQTNIYIKQVDPTVSAAERDNYNYTIQKAKEAFDSGDLNKTVYFLRQSKKYGTVN